MQLFTLSKLKYMNGKETIRILPGTSWRNRFWAQTIEHCNFLLRSYFDIDTKYLVIFCGLWKKDGEERAIHRQEVYFQSIAQIATWTPILMVAHTSTITTPRQHHRLAITCFASHSIDYIFFHKVVEVSAWIKIQ